MNALGTDGSGGVTGLELDVIGDVATLFPGESAVGARERPHDVEAGDERARVHGRGHGRSVGGGAQLHELPAEGLDLLLVGFDSLALDLVFAALEMLRDIQDDAVAFGTDDDALDGVVDEGERLELGGLNERVVIILQSQN